MRYGVLIGGLLAQDSDGARSSSAARHDLDARDFPDKLTTLRIGRRVNVPGAWGRAVRFGGMQYSTNFATQPGFIAFPRDRRQRPGRAAVDRRRVRQQCAGRAAPGPAGAVLDHQHSDGQRQRQRAARRARSLRPRADHHAAVLRQRQSAQGRARAASRTKPASNATISASRAATTARRSPARPTAAGLPTSSPARCAARRRATSSASQASPRTISSQEIGVCSIATAGSGGSAGGGALGGVGFQRQTSGWSVAAQGALEQPRLPSDRRDSGHPGSAATVERQRSAIRSTATAASA